MVKIPRAALPNPGGRPLSAQECPLLSRRGNADVASREITLCAMCMDTDIRSPQEIFILKMHGVSVKGLSALFSLQLSKPLMPFVSRWIIMIH